MTRYFFDFRHNREMSADTVGCEFATAEEAYLEAFKAAQEMWIELLRQRQDPRRCAFEIRNDESQVLFVLPFWEVLESCRDYMGAKHPSILTTFRDSMAAVTHVRRAHEEFLREMRSAQQTLRESAQLIATPF